MASLANGANRAKATSTGTRPTYSCGTSGPSRSNGARSRSSETTSPPSSGVLPLETPSERMKSSAPIVKAKIH